MAERAAALVDALGSEVVRTHEPEALAGREVAATIAPRNPEELGSALARARELGCGLVIRGGGHRQQLGNPLRAVDAVLSTRALAEERG